MSAKPHVLDAWRGDASAPTPGASSGVLERPTLGPATAFEPLEQTVIAVSPGSSTRRSAGVCEEVLFVLSGAGALWLDQHEHALEPESGVYLAPGEAADVRATGTEPLRFVSVRIPEPAGAGDYAGEPTRERGIVRALAEQEAQDATAEREFRIVADPDCGLRSATHFVGYIPPGRAPVHYHTYDEVIYVLDGEGVMHAGGASTPIAEGSCIQLPARSLHCLENTGAAVMRIEAVFRPAGSPAAAYYPDGSPAYHSAPTVGP
jgi:mannose-6-phosphate isomerase-like protein (cupin superfamily)